jgi:hypothetical protein
LKPAVGPSATWRGTLAKTASNPEAETSALIGPWPFMSPRPKWFNQN